MMDFPDSSDEAEVLNSGIALKCVPDVTQIAVGGLSALEETFPRVHTCTTESWHSGGGKWSSEISRCLPLQN